MTNFTQTPTGNVTNDIRNLYDMVRGLQGADTLQTVTDAGATTTKSITIGSSITLKSGVNLAVLSIDPTTGRLQAVINGKKQQSW